MSKKRKESKQDAQVAAANEAFERAQREEEEAYENGRDSLKISIELFTCGHPKDDGAGLHMHVTRFGVLHIAGNSYHFMPETSALFYDLERVGSVILDAITGAGIDVHSHQELLIPKIVDPSDL